jgi:hypothetical protein
LLAHYHKRINVESTVMMIEAKFSDAVSSKTDVAMKCWPRFSATTSAA